MSVHNLIGTGADGKTFQVLGVQDLNCNDLSVANQADIQDLNVLGTTTGIGLSNLDDVSYIGPPTNGEVLTYDSLFQEWQNKPAGGGSGAPYTRDHLVSDTNSPPTPVAATLATTVTVAFNNDAGGFGGFWDITLPNGTVDGQRKMFSIPLSGTTNTVGTRFTGQFSKGLTTITYAGSSAPRAASFIWDATDSLWLFMGAGSPSFA